MKELELVEQLKDKSKVFINQPLEWQPDDSLLEQKYSARTSTQKLVRILAEISNKQINNEI